MRRLRSDLSSAGTGLVEHLVAMSIVGSLLLSVVPVSIDVAREAARARKEATTLAVRWEALRRFRHDVSRAESARELQLSADGAEGVELTGGIGNVLWAGRDGLLHRVASPGPVVQGAALEALFWVETRGGRTVVTYRFEDEVGAIAGKVLLGSAP